LNIFRTEGFSTVSLGNPFIGKGYNFCMAVAVSLRDLVDELQMLPNEGTAYLNKVTGKVITLTDDIVAMAEIDDEIEEELEDITGDMMNAAPDLETEYYQEVKRVLAFDPDYLKLPSRFEIHEYEIMERFCLSVPDGKISDVLLGKIRGSGAFHRFKNTIYQYGLEDDWFKYRDEAYKEIAIAWLESNRIAFANDMNRREQNAE
jgi:Uncharacterised protein family (UPF0158)